MIAPHYSIDDMLRMLANPLAGMNASVSQQNLSQSPLQISPQLPQLASNSPMLFKLDAMSRPPADYSDYYALTGIQKPQFKIQPPLAPPDSNDKDTSSLLDKLPNVSDMIDKLPKLPGLPDMSGAAKWIGGLFSGSEAEQKPTVDLGNAQATGTAEAALKAGKDLANATTEGGIGKFLGDLTGGIFKGGMGTAFGADLLGGVGTVLGSKLVKGLFGDSKAQTKSALEAADKAAQLAVDKVAQNKSALLQNTNALGQQGAAAGIEAQRRINSQMVSGDAVADKNRLLASGDSLQQNAMQMAQQGMRQNQMSQQNLAKSVMNMRGGSGVANMGALQEIAGQQAAGNLQAMRAGQEGLQQSAAQQANIASQASDIYQKDLASNFQRNVAPALNQWENFQGMASSLAGPMVSQAMGIANQADNASYNLFGTAAKTMGTRAGSEETMGQYMKHAVPTAIQSSIAGGDIFNWSTNQDPRKVAALANYLGYDPNSLYGFRR